MTAHPSDRSLRIALVSRDNGVGLSTDMNLLEPMLTAAGHRVSRVEWNRPSMPRVDVAIFLELWSPRLARCAARTVGVFNLEWFQHGWGQYLRRISQLWAKSMEAQAIYHTRFRAKNATFTGFLGRDMYDPTIPQQEKALHVRGKSDFKNTQAVVDAWRMDPTLPSLTIISSVPLEVPSYVRVLGRVPDDQLRYELNTATFHVCPSRTEGWGHYITEALSTGGIVLTTNAGPMNEHVRPTWGILLDPARIHCHGLVNAYTVNAQSIVQAMHEGMSLSHEQRTTMGILAREHFHNRNGDFANRCTELLRRI